MPPGLSPPPNPERSQALRHESTSSDGLERLGLALAHLDSHHGPTHSGIGEEANAPNTRISSRPAGSRKRKRYVAVIHEDQIPAEDEHDPAMVQEQRRLRLACPYFKHDPQRFRNQRVCSGPGWSTVHRLKEHLYRKHQKPPYRCPRCLKSFPTMDDLSLHQRGDAPCQVREDDSTAADGFDKAQENSLRSRRNKIPSSRTESERWKEIYNILFPNARTVPSPFYEDDDIREPYDRSLTAYERFLSEEPPLRIKLMLSERIYQLLSSHASREYLTSQLIQLFWSYQPELLREFKNQAPFFGRNPKDDGTITTSDTVRGVLETSGLAEVSTAVSDADSEFIDWALYNLDSDSGDKNVGSSFREVPPPSVVDVQGNPNIPASSNVKELDDASGRAQPDNGQGTAARETFTLD